MKLLSTKSKQQLRAQAHALKPVILIGSKGLTEAVQKEIDIALTTHELIKIKVNDHERDAVAAMAAEICEFQKAQLIQKVGHIMTVWRKKPA